MLVGAVWAQNVGIGTALPSERLDVDGNLRVRGLSGTGCRPVYVDPNGVLRTGGTGDSLMEF
ncbi:MAG: hypothetical protein N3E49_09285 [Bacteroidia bacterium]|nr:hypothetical protein [Bacteroidia bacterium]